MGHSKKNIRRKKIDFFSQLFRNEPKKLNLKKSVFRFFVDNFYLKALIKTYRLMATPSVRFEK